MKSKGCHRLSRKKSQSGKRTAWPRLHELICNLFWRKLSRMVFISEAYFEEQYLSQS